MNVDTAGHYHLICDRSEGFDLFSRSEKPERDPLNLNLTFAIELKNRARLWVTGTDIPIGLGWTAHCFPNREHSHTLLVSLSTITIWYCRSTTAFSLSRQR